MWRRIAFGASVVILAASVGYVLVPDTPGVSIDPPTAADLSFAEPRLVRGCPFGGCFEPTLAIVGRTWAVTDASGAFVAFSSDEGASWRELPSPLPPPTVQAGGDGTIQADAQGRFWLSALARSRAMLAFEATRGVFLASTTDGLTWRSAYLPLPGNVDRQWIIPDGDDLWLTYNDLDRGIRFVRTAAGGTSVAEIHDIAPGAHIHGQGLRLASGRLAVPLFAGGAGLHLAISADEGRSWRLAPIAGAPPGDFFPSIAQDSSGALWAAWRGAFHDIRIARSADEGDTWSEPRVISAEGERAGVGPWLLATQRGPTVGYFAVAARDAVDPVGVRVGDILARGRAASNVAAFNEHRPGTTDFSHGAATPEGDAVWIWTDRAEIRVARER